MSEHSVDFKSLSEEVKIIGASIEARKFESILKKHSEDSKNVRRALAVLISDFKMEKMMEKLKKCNRTDVIEAAYCMKEQFNEKMKDNALVFEDYKDKLKRKKAFEKHLRDEIARLEKQILGLQNLTVEDSSLENAF